MDGKQLAASQDAFATGDGTIPEVGDVADIQGQAEVIGVENGEVIFRLKTVNGAEVKEVGGKTSSPEELDAEEEQRMRQEARRADGLSGM